MKKRILSMVVALSMALSLFPVFSLTASAAYAFTGSGTSASPYIIASEEAFADFIRACCVDRNYSAKYWRLECDIDMNNVNISSDAVRPYSYITGYAAECKGYFGYVRSAL